MNLVHIGPPLRTRAWVATLTLLLAGAAGLAGGSSAAAANSTKPSSLTAANVAVSPPARDLRGTSPDNRGVDPPRVPPLGVDSNGDPERNGGGRPSQSDPLALTSRPSDGTPSPSLVFAGSEWPGFGRVPDANGDVSKDNYVQTVNRTTVAIYNKQGKLVTPRFTLGDLWPASSACHQNGGDPIALYDALANRWLLAQLGGSAFGPNVICFAVSRSGDPTRSYFLYEFFTPCFPDYFKVGVSPSGYYVSTNECTYSAYALDRAKMLAGDPSASAIRFEGETNFLMPASVTGRPVPLAQGGLFYTFKDSDSHGGGSDRIELFELSPDFADPGSSSFTLLDSFPIASFTYTVCGAFVFECIPQGGTPQTVDAVSEWPMYRFPYRRFRHYEALVGNFTVGGGDGGAGAAIRWFELRNSGTGWSLFQEGTLDTPSVDQWMGSINIDSAGDIALGYSESSDSTFPSIRYATRTPGDPAGALRAEQVLQAGAGSGTGSERWGDYSSMSIDPADGCGFWYTNQYYGASQGSDWKTAIGKFTVPGCK